MNKQIYIGSTPLIDLTGYATESYVDTAVSNVDVTDQLQNYVLKTSLDASIDAVDASIASTDASIAAIKSTLADIVSDGSTDTIINTWAEMKDFLADYTTASDLSTLINTVKTQAVADASADAASKYQLIGNYLVSNDVSIYAKKSDLSAYAKDASLADYAKASTVYTKNEINTQLELIAGSLTDLNNRMVTSDDISTFVTDNDISTFVDAAAVATAINSSIAALDLANTYQPIGSYLVADDISTFVDSATIAATYETKNDASNHVAGAGVTNIVTISAADYELLETKSATTLYIVSD